MEPFYVLPSTSVSEVITVISFQHVYFCSTVPIGDSAFLVLTQ